MELISCQVSKQVPEDGCVRLWDGYRPIEAMEVYQDKTITEDTSKSFQIKDESFICLETNDQTVRIKLTLQQCEISPDEFTYKKGAFFFHPSMEGSTVEIFVLYWKRNFFDWLLDLPKVV